MHIGLSVYQNKKTRV